MELPPLTGQLASVVAVQHDVTSKGESVALHRIQVLGILRDALAIRHKARRPRKSVATAKPNLLAFFFVLSWPKPP